MHISFAFCLGVIIEKNVREDVRKAKEAVGYRIAPASKIQIFYTIALYPSH